MGSTLGSVNRRLVFVLTLCLFAADIGRAQQPSITVINMIPRGLSYENNQDSEPNLAVNPVNVNQMAGSAFTPGLGFCGAETAPIYISLNAGNTWAANCILPSDESGLTEDITLRFGGSSNRLYAAILRLPHPLFQWRMNILRTSDFTSPEIMAVLADRLGVDQPYVQASTIATSDRIYIGNNDFLAPNHQTATVDQSLDSEGASPSFALSRVETRMTDQQNGPATRLSIHPDGTLYGVFYGWRSVVGSFWTGATITTDVVVVRDDNGATGSARFSSLKDSDGLPGLRVVRDRKLPWFNASQPNFGNERFVGSNLTIAVDPRAGKSGTIYIAWADRLGSDDYTLHLRRSIDRGVTWSDDLKTITNATNPAVAINTDGIVAFLYQQLTGSIDRPRWETHVELSTSDAALTSGQNYVLATVRADKPRV
jgi:hypothetical protein